MRTIIWEAVFLNHNKLLTVADTRSYFQLILRTLNNPVEHLSFKFWHFCYEQRHQIYHGISCITHI